MMLSFHASTSFNLLFLFFCISSIYLAKFFLFHFKKTALTRSNGLEEDEFEGDEIDEDHLHDCSKKGNQRFNNSQCLEKEDLVADIILGGEALLFLPTRGAGTDPLLVEEAEDPVQNKVEEISTIQEESHPEEYALESVNEEEEEEQETEEKLEMEGSDLKTMPTPEKPYHEISLANDSPSKDDQWAPLPPLPHEENKNSSPEESFLDFTPPTETEKFHSQEDEGEEIPAGSFTGGSTSHSSHEWRSSTNYRGSETEDPFSSSSRRSSSRWENFTVYRKYDEDMMFFDRISAQKLSETESLRSIQVQPRSISQRIVHRLSVRNQETEYRQNPFQELEAAYVAQICLTWEALNWNYKNFQRLKASRGDQDLGCPAHIAQQFQQFQVLLQRFIEMEPYERGRRPEVYARIRSSSPKLLQVPEFQDSEAHQSKQNKEPRISSAEFLIIIEDAIRTFMNFLSADKKKHCEILRSFLKKNQINVDPTFLHLLKKANKRKKRKLKDIRRGRKCFRKRKLKEEEALEILMSLIDLKLVSRVLRMSDITKEQLHWCEEKMSKVRVWEGKLRRDSTPLFFPSH